MEELMKWANSNDTLSAFLKRKIVEVKSS